MPRVDFDPAHLRRLTPRDDLEAVQAFILRAADYWAMEQGEAPSPDAAQAFFAEGPPGRDPSSLRKLGLFQADGSLGGIVDLADDHPEAGDVYLGLLVLDPELRAQGLGGRIFAHLLAEATASGASRMLLAVLDENSRARAFWERQGFQIIATLPGFRLGQKTHVVHRMARPTEPA